MILPNKNILVFLKEAVKESNCVLDFTKPDHEFERYYKMSKKEAKLTINALEKQIINCEKDLKDGTYHRMQKFIEEKLREEHANKTEKK